MLPLFLSSGGHVQRDIVGQIKDLNHAHPELEIALHQLGELVTVRSALASYISDTIGTLNFAGQASLSSRWSRCASDRPT